MPVNKKFCDFTGYIFFRFTVREFVGYRGNQSYWLCNCECGNQRLMPASSIKDGRHKSCGCYGKEVSHTINRTHGLTRDYKYRLWRHIKARCFMVSYDSYPHYGGRGITMHPKWQFSFTDFLADLLAEIGERPSPDYSLDRVNNNGNYEPGNMRWATDKEQNNNTRSTRWLQVGGTNLTISQWSERTGESSSRIHNRLAAGWPIWKALGFASLYKAEVANK